MFWPRVFNCDESDLVGGAIARRASPFWHLLGELCRSLGGDDPIAHRYLLLLRFILANSIALGLVGAAAGQGWVRALLVAGDSAYSLVIVVVFAVGLFWSGQHITQLSRSLNEVKAYQVGRRESAPAYIRAIEGRDAGSRAILASTLKLRLAGRIAPIRHIANSLVLLGLTGTVIGFIIALSGVQPDAASDVSAIGPMISTLIRGMSIALYTTLVGSLLNIWLMVNVRLLEGGTIKLLTATVELGERHART